jgi:hypothetical protein
VPTSRAADPRADFVRLPSSLAVAFYLLLGGSRSGMLELVT